MKGNQIKDRLNRSSKGDWSDELLALEAVGLAGEILSAAKKEEGLLERYEGCLLYTSPSPRD